MDKFRQYKKIRLKDQRLAAAKKISEKFACSEILSRVLAARGFEANEELALFLDPTLRNGLPHPDKLKNINAAKAVADMVSQGAKVAVCCDFDVDGLSSGAMLHRFFKDIGADSQVFVPDRFSEGYGLNRRIVDDVISAGCTLLIALDFGTTNFSEILYAKERGLLTVIVDHHHVSDVLPDCDFFINPEQAGCGFAGKVLCAAGLTWYFLIALKECCAQAREIDARNYLDLACLGTICDMVPLLGVNRVIAKKGLERLENTERCGLQALKAVSGIKKHISATDVSFLIGPRINAAGRMLDGSLVIELLTTDDKKRADALANKLDRLNSERQDLEKKIKAEAIRRISNMLKVPYGIVISDKAFHTGVIGIVAQRLVETYYRPSAVIGCDQNGIYKGSCRGIKGFDVVEALSRVSAILLNYGGHVGAGGFSLEQDKLSAFTIAFNDECARQLAGLELSPIVEADTEIEMSDIDIKLIEELSKLVPYGMGNPQVVLLLKNLRVLEVSTLRSAHLKAIVSDGKRNLPALLWNQIEHPAIQSGAMINLACRPSINSYNGLLEIQLQIQAVEKVS